MSITTTLAACNVNPALNGPDGAVDLPSSLDDALRYALSFIAQLRDGAGVGWQTGMASQFCTTVTPSGWLKLNGQLVSRATYANLWTFAQASGLASEPDWAAGFYGRFSVGDGVSTFRVPDLRGLFMRGLDESRGIDVGRVFGAFQDHENLLHSHGTTEAAHSHTGTTVGAGGHLHSINDPSHLHPNGVLAGSGVNYNGAGGNPAPVYTNTGAAVTGITINAVGDHSHPFTTAGVSTGLTINNSGGTEARPKNIAWPWYVKY